MALSITSRSEGNSMSFVRRGVNAVGGERRV
jgi:hypothetical protein